MIFLYILIIIIITITRKGRNPIIIATNILFIRLVSFFIIKTESSLSIFPSIFTLLFTGGILIIFMTLSSLIPNIEMKKIILLPFIYFYFFCFTNEKFLFQNFSGTDFKANFVGFSLLFLVFIILTYFFCFIFFLSKSKESIRSFFCYMSF